MTEIPKEVPFSPKPDMQKPPEKKAEPAPPPIPPEVIHPDTEAQHSQKRVIDLRTISFEVDPMVAHKIQMQMQDNPRFAQTIHTNITKLFYDYLIYKVRMRENLNLAIKGETRCMAGSTLIHTENGLKRLDSIKAGEIVLSFATSPSRRYFTWMPVTKIFKFSAQPTLRITFNDDSHVICTKNHSLLTLKTSRKVHSCGADARCTVTEWRKAEILKAGDKIFSPLGYPDFKIVKKITQSKSCNVYDLHIPQTHCYIANGIISHNSGKSTVGISLGHFISSLTKITYGPYHICANESEYYSKVKNAKFSELYHIDEQKESKFGSGCLPAGSEILTECGWKQIERITDKDLIMTFNTAHGTTELSHCFPQKYRNPFKYNLKVALRNGICITTTPNHEWLLSGKTYHYKPARKLCINDRPVLGMHKDDKFGNSIEHSFARILGFMAGDGHLTKRHYPQKWGTHNRVQFTNSEDAITTQFIADITTYFQKNLNWFHTKHCHMVEGYNGTTYQHYFHDKEIFESINAHIPNENKSAIVQIPAIIKNGNMQVQREFIKAIFSCDGTISRKGWKKQNFHVSISTVSHRMAHDLMLILTALGFTPYLNSFAPPPKKDGYKRKKRFWVSLFRRNDLIKFSNEIGFFGRKQIKLMKAINSLKSKSKNTNNWTTENGVLPFSIKRIQKVRACKHVYDLETPQNHNYICKNFVLHNSFREEMSIMDIQNIIAKQCVHTIWIYPSDFIARNSVYGLETYGKDLKNKLVRCIVYDVRKTVMGMATPLGYIIVPKVQDPAFQNMPEEKWDKYRIKNKYELKRPDFDSQLEEDYEKKKDEWIEREKGREGAGFHHEERFKLGVWLGQQKQYGVLEKKAERRALARQVFRDLTEAEVDEIVVIADMGIKPEDIEKLTKKKAADARKEVDG